MSVRLTLKHTKFANEKMGDKSTHAINGISTTSQDELARMGMSKAYHLLAIFLKHDKDVGSFTVWLQSMTSIEDRHAEAPGICLKAWCFHNL